MTSICSAGSADSLLGSNELGCELSPSVRSTHTAAQSSQGIGQASPASRMSEPSQAPMSEQPTLFAEDTLASPSALLGSEQAAQMTVTSGRSIAVLSTNCGPLGSLERMLLGTSAWGSTMCLPIWNASATPAGRLLFRLQPWEPCTDEAESGLLPTPRASKIGGYSSPGFSPTLAEAVRMWPTPIARDRRSFKGAARSPNSLGTEPLSVEVSRAEGIEDGSLNPEWVEWLMRFPEKWTALEPSGMQSSPKSRKSSGGQSSKRSRADD